MTKHLLKLREKAEQIGYLASLCFFFLYSRRANVKQRTYSRGLDCWVVLSVSTWNAHHTSRPVRPAPGSRRYVTLR